jgi:hypothetical protein
MCLVSALLVTNLGKGGVSGPKSSDVLHDGSYDHDILYVFTAVH